MTNTELLTRDAAHLIHPLHDPHTQQQARVWVKGQGAQLTDADGREFIDGLSGLWNVIVGHGRQELAEAAATQAATLAGGWVLTGTSTGTRTTARSRSYAL